jgi:phosphoribosylglycinamide formyltransferase 1
MKKRIAIFISGRGSNMEAIAGQARDGILRDVCEIVLVFSNRPDAAGLKIAEDMGISTACIPSAGKKRGEFDREVLNLLQPLNIDLIVLAGYMRLLSPLLIRAYPDRIVNIHPADTRAYQGIDAYAWAFDNKLPKTCITVHFVDEGMDTGEIIAQRELNIKGLKTLEQIEEMGLALEHKMYSEVLRDLCKNI